MSDTERTNGLPGIREYLDREWEIRWREFYQNQTRRIVNIGDVDLRLAARQDLALVSQVRIASEKATSTEVEEHLETLSGIISGGSKHPLLSKVVATLAYCDICVENNIFSEEMIPFFVDTTKTEPEPGGGEMILGALYARLCSTVTRLEGGQEMLEQLDERLIGKIDSRNRAIRKLAIHAASSTISDMFKERELRMRFPEVTIVGGEGEEDAESLGEAEYPHKTMHLGIGYLPSLRKLEQSALKGMPDASQHILDPRLPRVLVGIEVSRAQKDARTRGGIVSVPDRKLIHTYIRALRKPERSAREVFTSVGDYTRENAMDNISFDSLSFIIAVRVSRELSHKFDDIDKAMQPDDIKEKRKEIQANRVIDNWLNKISRPLGKRKDGSEPSILSVAMEEFERINGEKWDFDLASQHIRHSALALSLKSTMGKLEVRPEEAIADMYVNHVWNQRLTPEDKSELAMALLEDPDSRYWRRIPQKYQNLIAMAIHEGKPLEEEAKGELVGFLNSNRERLMVLRCETVRNIQEPPGLFEIYKNDD